MATVSLSRSGSVRVFESARPSIRWAGLSMTQAAHTGPANGPLPDSSTPQTRLNSSVGLSIFRWFQLYQLIANLNCRLGPGMLSPSHCKRPVTFVASLPSNSSGLTCADSKDSTLLILWDSKDPALLILGFAAHGTHQLCFCGDASIHFRPGGILPDTDPLPQYRCLEYQLITRLHRLFEAGGI